MDQKTHITICCPSRGRPMLAQRMSETAFTTADNPEHIDIKFYLNEDDPELPTYKKVLQNYTIGPDRSTVMSWNMLAESSNSYLYMLAGDDIQFMTHGWDTEFMNQFNVYPDGIFMISFCNGKDNLKTAPHPVVTKQWSNALGYFWPPQFFHWCVDSYTRDLAESIDRYVYLDKITVKAKKITEDTTAQKIRTKGIPERDQYVYDKIKKCYLEYDINKLTQAIDNFTN